MNRIDGPIVNNRMISPLGEFDLSDQNDDGAERASLVIGMKRSSSAMVKTRMLK